MRDALAGDNTSSRVSLISPGAHVHLIASIPNPVTRLRILLGVSGRSFVLPRELRKPGPARTQRAQLRTHRLEGLA